MKRKPIKRIWFFLALVTIAAGCTTPATPPATESTSGATAAISADNANSLKHILQVDSGEDAASVAWAADGSAVWVVNPNGASLYASESLDMIGMYESGPEAVVYDVSSDGDSALVSMGGSALEIFDASSGGISTRIPAEYPFASASFSPDGSLAAVPAMDAWEVTIWDTDSGEAVQTLTGFETAAPVYDAFFGAHSDTLIWTARATVQPMTISSESMGPPLYHEDFVSAVAISPDGQMIATSAAATIGDSFQPAITLWDAASGEILRQVGIPTAVNALDFSPDGNLIAAGTQDGILILTSPEGGTAGKITIDGEGVFSLNFSPDGTYLLAGGSSGTVQIFAVIP